MRIAHVISRRPHLVSSAVATAYTFADAVVVGLHGFEHHFGNRDIEVVTSDDYIDLTNKVLKAAKAHAPATLRVDDDDYYPAGHEKILEAWKPGATVWGRVTIRGCDGKVLRTGHPDMCAGVLPTKLRVTGDALGRVADSIRTQTRPIEVDTGVVKLFCLADASWIHSPRWARQTACEHTIRDRAAATD